VTDRLRSYGSAMKTLGMVARQQGGRWLITGPRIHTCRSDEEKAKFRDIKTLQKFASVHASIHNHFHQDRHLSCRSIVKHNWSVALAEWRQLAA
jgi:putative transposase